MPAIVNSVPVFKTWIIRRSGTGVTIIGNDIHNEPHKVHALTIVASAGQDIMAFDDAERCLAILLAPGAATVQPEAYAKVPGGVCKHLKLQHGKDHYGADEPFTSCNDCGAQWLGHLTSAQASTAAPLRRPSQSVGKAVTLDKARGRLRTALFSWKINDDGLIGLDNVVNEIALVAAVAAGAKVYL